ncbi:helix-turn-helix transcriptional regulator [Halorientalis salina]|uniref:helix-turn-helix transcriptional regulator n=1 Tax=Halorientalis salina TaxID=2932266 RepID=UPI0010AD6FB7|nr:helix-turn-helix domain-containing protein [Halorientalis salina]
MSRLLSLALVCVLLVGTAFVPAGAVAIDGRSVSADQSAELSTPDQFTSATFNIEVYENGSARWTFRYYTGSLNDSEAEQFEAFADRFESEETDIWTRFQQRAQALVSAGTDATGRNMTADGFQRSASLDTATVGTQGRVQMSFLWHGFAVVDGTDVIASDVFEGEFYIGPNQWLVFEAGPNLAFVADGVDPLPDVNSSTSIGDSDTLTWKGERRFSDNRPRVAFTSETQSDESTAEMATTVDGTNGSTKQAGANGQLQLLLVGLVVLAVGVGAGVAWRSGLVGPTASDDTTEQGDSATEAASSSAAGMGTAARANTDATPDEPAVPEEELLSDEDRVLQMLETNGGRMKQANIVDETGWSKSKVSMLLSEMEDEELISKLRVGRENIVSLSGHEPDAAGSPFDDED